MSPAPDAAHAGDQPEGEKSEGDVDPNVALFAQREKEATRAEQARKRAEAEERKRQARGEELRKAKDQAAERVRTLRQKGTTGPDGLDEAEAAYRNALTEFMAYEEGEGDLPGWAATEVEDKSDEGNPPS